MADLLERKTDVLSRIRVNEKKLSTVVTRRVIGAPTLELSVDSIGQLTIVLEDPGFEMLKKGVFNKRALVTYDKDLRFEVVALETGGGAELLTLTVVCLEQGPQKMVRAEGPLMTRDLSPTEFMELRAKDAGLEFTGKASAKRSRVGRLAPQGEDPENDWTCGQRLAKELGFWAFAAAGRYYFGPPTWLVDKTKELLVRFPRAKETDEIETDTVPVCRRSGNRKERATVSLELPFDPGSLKARPGRVLELRGIPTFQAGYIITGVSITLANDSIVGVEASTPVDPEPEPPEVVHDDAGAGVGSAQTVATGGESSAGFVWPVIGPISTNGYFGAPRPGRLHYGLDIAVPTGTRIVAAAAGVVTIAGYLSGYGNVVYINHGNGWETRYAHLESFAVGVGAQVAQGQVVGYCDSTGISSGAHLHLETRFDGVAQDPQGVLP